MHSRKTPMKKRRTRTKNFSRSGTSYTVSGELKSFNTSSPIVNLTDYVTDVPYILLAGKRDFSTEICETLFPKKGERYYPAMEPYSLCPMNRVIFATSRIPLKGKCISFIIENFHKIRIYTGIMPVVDTFPVRACPRPVALAKRGRTEPRFPGITSLPEGGLRGVNKH